MRIINYQNTEVMNGLREEIREGVTEGVMEDGFGNIQGYNNSKGSCGVFLLTSV